ncbi:hypothetical protein G9A89_001239 [Geosiphon pyriformis]|nr:hypothetical protein G9A89_001239 [Geosiphon pyriformis]
MSSTSSIENATSPLDWLEGALIVIKENLSIFPASEYSKVAELVKIYLERDQKTPENLFDRLNNKSSKRSIDYIALGFCLEHGIGTIPNLKKAFLEFQKAANAKDSFGQFFLGYCYDSGIGTVQDREKAFDIYSKAAEAGNTNAQNVLALCYDNGLGTTKNREKAFKLYSKVADAGHTIAQTRLRTYCLHGLQTMKDLEKVGNPSSQTNIEMYYQNGWGITKSLEETFEFYLKAAEVGNQIAQYNLGWCYQNGWGTTKNLEKAFEIYSKAAETNNSSYRNNFPDLNVLDLILKDQNSLERFILQFQYRGLKSLGNSKGEFLDFEAFFDLLSDEFKCLKCGNLGIIITGSPICPFCDTDKSDNNVFEAGLPKCPGCNSTLKDPLWCNSCESSRFSKIWRTWDSGEDNIDKYIEYTQNNSENSRECLEWISPNEIEFLDKVGEGGFSIVKKGSWERGKILFWDEKNQKYERSGVTKVVLKYFKDKQNKKYINSDELIAYLTCASCKYILECYGITKDVITDEFVMVLSFAEHGDLRAFLKMKETTLTWEMFLRILFQIASGLRFIHNSKLVHGNLHPGNILVLKSNPLKIVIGSLGVCRPANYPQKSGEIFGVIRYLAPEICNLSPHTKYSNIYSCAIISWEIISGERPWNRVIDHISIQLYTIQGKRLPIQKHIPQCIKEIIEKNWDDKPHCRDSAEELQQRVIAARDNCDLYGFIREKKIKIEKVQDTMHSRSRSISSPELSENERYDEYEKIDIFIRSYAPRELNWE